MCVKQFIILTSENVKIVCEKFTFSPLTQNSKLELALMYNLICECMDSKMYFFGNIRLKSAHSVVRIKC